MTDYKKHLKRQLKFIETSVDQFDQGNVDEAVRIATAIRVIIHTTKRSTGLLTHLERTDVCLVSSCPAPDNAFQSRMEQVYFFGLGSVEIGPRGIRYVSNLVDQPQKPLRYLPSSEWWGEVVWIPEPGLHVSRCDIILAACNKDGGAHVDPDLPDSYRYLMERPFSGMRMHSTGPDRPEHVHLHCARLIGEEVVASKELRDI